MQKINLRDYYPFYGTDVFVDVPDEVAAALLEAERLERNYIRRVFWNKAHYSLDARDGIEYDALLLSLSPCEIYERKMTAEQLHAAIVALPGYADFNVIPTRGKTMRNSAVFSRKNRDNFLRKARRIPLDLSVAPPKVGITLRKCFGFISIAQIIDSAG
jgi:hypothetical protein